jgi:hypothetical protein
VLATEPLVWAPRDYVQMPEIPKHWQVIDVGPGQYPLKRANMVVDRSGDILKPISDSGQATMQTDLNKGLPGIADKQFDYVWCSHVLEHVQDPVACAATLSRIGKSGTIVMPSAIKDGIFNFEEKEHLWHILPNPTTGKPPIFVRMNREFIYPLEDELVKQATSFLYRTGSNHECTAERNLRSWYQRTEQYLDVVYHWKGSLELIVHA